jgi:glycosyltransferase involved in cell wall biosynthesis
VIKVVHLIGCFNKAGGTERQLNEIVLHQNLNLKVSVIEFWCNGEFSHELRNKNIECISLGAKSSIDFIGFIKLFFLLKKLKPDVLNCWLPSANIYGTIIGKLAGISAIVTSIRNVDDWKSKYYILLDKAILRISNRIIVNSDMAKLYSVRKLGISESKFIKINNILPSNLISHKVVNDVKTLKLKLLPGIKGDEIILLSVNRLHEEKRTMSVLDIFFNLRLENILAKLIIIGQGEQYEEIEAYCKKSEFNNDVYLLGWKDNVYDYMTISDIFLLLSIREGVSNSLVEAQYLGLPSIVTNVGGNSEVVEDKKTGYIVPKYNFESQVISHIKNLLENKNKMQSFRKESRNNIIQNYSIAKTVGAYENLYNSLK